MLGGGGGFKPKETCSSSSDAGRPSKDNAEETSVLRRGQLPQRMPKICVKEMCFG